MSKRKLMKDIRWFGNDQDGLSIMDTLTIAMFIFFILFKFIHIYISIGHKDSISLLSQFNLIMASMDEFMRLITIFYFSEKTLDNTITKIGDIKNKGYLIKEMQDCEEDSDDTDNTNNESYPITETLDYTNNTEISNDSVTDTYNSDTYSQEEIIEEDITLNDTSKNNSNNEFVVKIN